MDNTQYIKDNSLNYITGMVITKSLRNLEYFVSCLKNNSNNISVKFSDDKDKCYLELELEKPIKNIFEVLKKYLNNELGPSSGEADMKIINENNMDMLFHALASSKIDDIKVTDNTLSYIINTVKQ